MKGKINLKTIVILIVLVLVGVLVVLGVNTVRTYMSGAASGNEPINVLAVPGDDGRSANISWTSDNPTIGIVEYGTTPASLLLRNVESQSTTSHNVTLSSLRPNVNYYFRIKVGEDIFDNNGIPYSFKTKNVESGEEIIPGISPVNVTIVPTSSFVPVPVTDGGCNRTSDYNGDGVVNSLDYVNCLNRGESVSPTSSAGSGTCVSGVDYDGNGTVNSLDRIKCLQNSQQ